MTRRMRLVAPTVPVPGPPRWRPAEPSVPGWELAARERWRGAAEAVTTGVPVYHGDCEWKIRRNRQLIAQYGRRQG